MKQIDVTEIVEAVEHLCQEANFNLGADIDKGLAIACKDETSPLGKEILERLQENAVIARSEKIPMCQDTGMAVLFIELGQDLTVAGGDLNEALNQGVRQGYEKGYLRRSVVSDPFLRTNTGDNTPAVIHYDIVPGDTLRIVVAPKGFGSENMSALKMCKPSEGLTGVLDFVVETVEKAGANPCPPVIVGVGVGGTAEKAMLMAKHALLHPVGERNRDERIGTLEKELLERINQLGIGPQGYGGITTALDVHMEVYPTHIAGLPVAVNIGCHATRHQEVLLQGREVGGQSHE